MRNVFLDEIIIRQKDTMKKSFRFIILFLISLLLLACEKNSEKDTVTYTILSGACGTINLVGNIGPDFNTALDSLETIREPFLTGGCPGSPCYDYYVDVDTLSIDYSLDDREFLGVIFKDVGNSISIFSMSDVIDTYGYYYTIHWCDD
jgi:hypothetical protein